MSRGRHSSTRYAKSSSARTGPPAPWPRSAAWCATLYFWRSKPWRRCPTPDFAQSAPGPRPPAAEGSRRRPDGQALSGRTQDVEKGVGPTAIPFVIEWKIPDGLHPGEAAATHDHGTTSVKRVVVGARDPDNVRLRLRLLLGDSGMYDVRESDSHRIEEVLLPPSGGEQLI